MRLGRSRGPASDLQWRRRNRRRTFAVRAQGRDGTAAGVAANKEIAHLAARCGGVRVIEAGREREFLNWLPLDMLGLGNRIAATISKPRLPGGGCAGWAIWRASIPTQSARGSGAAASSWCGLRVEEVSRWCRVGAPKFSPRRSSSNTGSTPGAAGIRDACNARADGRAASAARHGGRRYRARLRDDGHREFQSRVAVAAPSNDVRAILTLINLRLEASPPEAAVETIRIEIAPRVPRPAQADMFLPPAPAPDKLQPTIARLAALCGPGNVGTLSAENSHRPEAMRLMRSRRPPPPPIPENGAREKCDAARDPRDSSRARNRGDVLAGDSGVRPRRESRRARHFDRRPVAARRRMVARMHRRPDTHSDSSDKTNPALKHGLELHDGACSERIRARSPRKI